MAQLQETCGKKYIVETHTMESLDRIISDNIHRFARRKNSPDEYMEGYTAARIDGCIMLYYSAGIIDIDAFVEFSIDRCFRGE